MVGLIDLKSSVFEATKLLIYKSFQDEELVSPWTKVDESKRDIIIAKFSLVFYHIPKESLSWIRDSKPMASCSPADSIYYHHPSSH